MGRRVRLRLRRSWDALPDLQRQRWSYSAEDAARLCRRRERMIRKPLDLPPAVARAFVEDMRAYFAEENPIKRDGIAVRQLRALREHQGPREKKLRLSDVKELFAQMKD